MYLSTRLGKSEVGGQIKLSSKRYNSGLEIMCFFVHLIRLRVVSNFGDGNCGAGEIHIHAREISRRRDAKGT